MTEESIPELLARLEREHVPCDWEYCAIKVPHCNEHSITLISADPFPCDTARLVAYARSLEAAIRKLEAAKETNEGIEFGFNYVPVEDAYMDLLAALGEAQ